MSDDPHGITPKQRRFVDEYLIDLQCYRAAIRAGYSERSAPSIASQLLKNPKIHAAVQDAIEERAKRTRITQDRVLLELFRLATANMAEYIRVQEDGTAVVDLTHMTADQGAAIQEIISDYYIEGTGEDAVPVKKIRLRLHPRTKALELLGKHLGLGFAQRLEHTGPEGGPIETTIDVKDLSTDTLRRVLAEAAAVTREDE